MLLKKAEAERTAAAAEREFKRQAEIMIFAMQATDIRRAEDILVLGVEHVDISAVGVIF